MICPHCSLGVRLETESSSPAYTDEPSINARSGYDIAHGFCPECSGLIILLRYGRRWQGECDDYATRELIEIDRELVVWPHHAPDRHVESEVPDSYSTDFIEASRVLLLSPKASAALSRRLLQNVLRDEFQIKAGTLAAEIESFISRAGVPSQLTEAVDAVRSVGNFAAHPLKNTNTGEVIDVEPGEAEWLLDVLEALFDFTFVQPKRLQDRKAKINAKLATAGKPPMK